MHVCLLSPSRTDTLNPGFILESLEKLWKYTYVWVLFQNVLCRLLMGESRQRCICTAPGITVHKVETLPSSTMSLFPPTSLTRTHRAGLSPQSFLQMSGLFSKRRSGLTAAHSVCQPDSWAWELGISLFSQFVLRFLSVESPIIF